MFLRKHIRRMLLLGLAAIATPSAALADHRGYRSYRSRADADIDSLKASVRGGYVGWRLTVRYEIEIEDAYPGEAFDLMLHVTERGRTLADRFGRPLQFRVPLAYPTHVDDDELEFESRVSLALPAGSLHDAKRLRLHAVVVSRMTGRTLDHEDESVKLHGGRYDHGHGHARNRRGGGVEVEYDPPTLPAATPGQPRQGAQPRTVGPARPVLRPQMQQSRRPVADLRGRISRRRSL